MTITIIVMTMTLRKTKEKKLILILAANTLQPFSTIEDHGKHMK